MTISTTGNRVSYAGNGVTAAFAFPYFFFANADLVVLLNKADGTTVTKVLNTDYTVAGATNPAGGTVTMVVVPAAGETLVIYRDPQIIQTVDYVDNDPLPAASLENPLDRLTVIAQRLRELVDRGFRLPDSDTSGASTILPTPTASNIIAWNANATGLQNVDAATLATIVASGTANADIFSGTGAQTAFTLTANPGAINNLDISITGVTQRPGIDYTWAGGTTLTFVAAPPSGTNNVLVRYVRALPQGSADASAVTFIQGGTGAVTRMSQDKLRDVLNVLDFGAVSNAADNTTPFANAIARVSALGGGDVHVPAGTWFTGQIVIPSSVRILLDRGAIIKPKAGFAVNAFWVTANGAIDVEISGGSFEVDKATFPSTVPIYLDTAASPKVNNVRITKSGSIGIYGNNCTDALIERVTTLAAGSCNIQFDGASSARNRVRKCRVDATGTINHGIQFLGGGADCEATGNYITGAGIFGVSLFNVSRCIVSKNTIYNTTREAVNIEDGGDNQVIQNVCYWDTTTSQDFGISVWGQAVNGCNFNIVQGNKVINCGKSGIAIASTTSATYNKVVENIITNSNRLNLGTTNGGGAGVILYGTNAQQNDVTDNTVYDTIGTLRYGVFEWNSGGAPSLNRIFNNEVTNASLGNVSKAANSVEAFCQTAWQTYTPTVTSSTGTITTVGTVVGRYWETDKMVAVYVRATITTNGTGGGAVQITLPFTNNAAVGAMMHGREAQNTGHALTGVIAGADNKVLVRKYDNSYPAIDGSVIEISGFFIKA